jgi:sigma-B regulation protein RsbU (phosphoserine phosphatase)
MGKNPIMTPERVNSTEQPTRILIGEDQLHVSEALRLLLKCEGYQTESADSPAGVLEAAKARPFDLVLVDLNYSRDTTSGREGIDLVARLHELDGLLPVVVMTAWGSIDLAVEAMHRGARDFIQKPWGNERLLEVVRAQVATGRAQRVQQGDADREAADARRIQQGLLPQQVPQPEGYEIAAAWQPALLVGGDYFDVIPLGGHRTALCIADVAGKGLPAALLMANLQAAVHASATADVSPALLCKRIDQLLRRNLPEDRFITFFYGVLDSSEHTLTYSNAGHNHPLLLRRSEVAGRGSSAFALSAGGPVLGILDAPSFAQGRVQMQRGDRLVLYTDGVTEASNDSGELFSAWRLEGALREANGSGAAAIKARVFEALAQFSGGQFEDDATLLIVKRA